MRSIAFQYGGLEHLARALEDGDFELDVPSSVNVADGEWMLVHFEIEGSFRTAAAGKAIVRDDRVALRFSPRDWERLEKLAVAETCAKEPPFSRKQGPIAARPPSLPPSAAMIPDRVSGIGARVLVVDDEPLVREMVATMLEGVGLLVETARDAEEALERLRNRRIDLLVIDGELPGMSGHDLCRALRCDEKARRLPVLFLTSSSSSRDMVEAYAAGADDYMMKPFRAPELGARIFGLLQRAMSIPLTG